MEGLSTAKHAGAIHDGKQPSAPTFPRLYYYVMSEGRGAPRFATLVSVGHY